MGYAGKVEQRARARELRAEARTLAEIAAELHVAVSTVSVWCRDVEFEPRPRSRAVRRTPNRLARAKQAEVALGETWGRDRLLPLCTRDLLVAGTALYAGEGAKTDGVVKFVNSDARMVALFLQWLRTFFPVDEARLRVRLYLHEGLDLEAAELHWQAVTGIDRSRFGTPYRAVADPSRRRSKHVHGCASVVYCCARTHRFIMGLTAALLTSPGPFPG